MSSLVTAVIRKASGLASTRSIRNPASCGSSSSTATTHATSLAGAPPYQ